MTYRMKYVSLVLLGVIISGIGIYNSFPLLGIIGGNLIGVIGTLLILEWKEIK